MTPAQLKSFKEDMKAFFKMYSALTKYWTKDNSFPHITALMVLVQNLQFSGTNCHGYSHEDSVEKVKEIRECIEAMKEYYKDDYMVEMVSTEVECLIMGLVQESI